MKKILFLGKTLGHGGVEKQIVTLANSLVDLYAITLYFGSHEEDSIIHMNKKIKVLLGGNHSSLSFVNKIFLEKEVKDIIQELNPTIIICTDAIYNHIVQKAQVGKKIFWNHTGESINKEFYDIEVLSILSNEKNKKQVVIPNALDTIPSESSPLSNKQIVTVAKLTKNKRIDDMLDVFERVYQKDREVTLHIVGDGEEMNSLRKIVALKNLTKVVKFRGFLNREEMYKEFMNSSLFLLTSEKETFGLSLIEAMSAGLPCISFAISKHIEEIVQNDINGYVVFNRDKEKMASLILHILNNKKLSADLGSCAKETSLVYDIKSIKCEWLKIL